MPETETRDPRVLTDRWLAALEQVNGRVRQLAEDVDEAALGWEPPEGGWSLAQVLEHLCTANDSYFERIRPLLGPGGAPPATAGAAWKPTLVGRLLAGSMRSPRKVPAPKAWRPGPAVRPEVLAAFLRGNDELAGLLRASAGVDWRRARLRSPASALVRLNLGDAFTVLVAHEQRHLGQMERIRAHPGFPGAAAPHAP